LAGPPSQEKTATAIQLASRLAGQASAVCEVALLIRAVGWPSARSASNRSKTTWHGMGLMLLRSSGCRRPAPSGAPLGVRCHRDHGPAPRIFAPRRTYLAARKAGGEVRVGYVGRVPAGD